MSTVHRGKFPIFLACGSGQPFFLRLTMSLDPQPWYPALCSRLQYLCVVGIPINLSVRRTLNKPLRDILGEDIPISSTSRLEEYTVVDCIGKGAFGKVYLARRLLPGIFWDFYFCFHLASSCPLCRPLRDFFTSSFSLFLASKLLKCGTDFM